MISKKILKSIEKDALTRYLNRYKKNGISAQSLGWGSKEDQLVRFNTIIENFNLKGKTIMDVGCGFADLYNFLVENEINVNYIGVDIIPEFINYCKKEYPQHKFYCKNVMLDLELPNPDVIISLGTLNYNLNKVNNLKYSKMFIKRLFNLTNELLIVDFLSEYRTPNYPKENMVYYHKPEKIFKYVMNLTNDVTLIHNYDPIPQKEFMIGIEK